ncbi:MAG: rod shape-determining protein MreC [Oscillatoriales cyanobacterium SM2_2_1]|nr:rod shape-determining protein MreC [Oscillatoriales cyanobacterium SM2_2_1]
MDTLRRWWGRYSIHFLSALVGLAIALGLRITQGMPLLEAYQFFTQPWQWVSRNPEPLIESRTVELNARMAELESQNEQLKQLLNLEVTKRNQGTWAMVIGRSGEAWWSQMVLSKGSQDGVLPGAIALGSGGLVGRVTAASPHSSRLLLVSDPSSVVGVSLARSRFMGILRGQNQRNGVLEFFERDPDVRVGDVVLTSPYTTRFPPGIVVGQVVSINLDKQPAPEAVVAFSAPLGLLEYVNVQPFTAKSDALLLSP